MSSPVRILVIDDDEAVRDALAIRLEADGHQVVCFSSGNALLERDPPPTADVAFLDVRMPGLNGLEVLEQITQSMPALAVIMITGHADIAMAVRAMQTGAVDFVEKPFEDERIISALEFATTVADKRQTRAAEIDEASHTLARLTPREHETMLMVVEGHPSKAIAQALDISPRTVEIHRQRVMQKTGAQSVAQLVRIAMASGIVLQPQDDT